MSVNSERAIATRRVSPAKRLRIGQAGDVFDDGFRASATVRGGPEQTGSLRRAADSDLRRRWTMGGTSTDGLPRFGRSRRILATRIGRRLPGSGQYVPVHASEGDQKKRSGPRHERVGGSGE